MRYRTVGDRASGEWAVGLGFLNGLMGCKPLGLGPNLGTPRRVLFFDDGEDELEELLFENIVVVVVV